MSGPIARAPQRANRQDDNDRSVPRTLQPVARLRVRPRASSSPPVKKGPPPIPPKKQETFGPYVILEPMGEGGMARVHRAERIGADGVRKVVALKRMWEHLSEDHDFVASFIQEGTLASQLRHDNIAQAYDVGKIDDTYYIAMELVPGPTLNDLMIQSRTAAGAIPLPIIVEILIQLCDALEYAHAAGIIHRDVSPANVIVSSNGTIKLIDFGIAKAAHSRIHTQAGFIKGKLSYVAPEYTHGKLDRRADLFAVGVVAHELLTGRRLFLAETDVEIIHNVREKLIAPPSRTNRNVELDLEDIVMTALQRDPDLRWNNAAALRTALINARDEIGTASRREIRDWVEWAFTQEPRDSIDKLAEKLETTRANQPRPASHPSKIIIEAAVATFAPRDPTPTYREPPPMIVLDQAPDEAPTLDAAAPAPRVPASRFPDEPTYVAVPAGDTVRHVRRPRDSAPTIVEDFGLHLEVSRPEGVRLAMPTLRLNLSGQMAPWLAVLVILAAIGAAAWYGWLAPALSMH